MVVDAWEEKRQVLRLLDGLENGGLPTADAVVIAEDVDPVFVYVVVEFLRRVYPASDPAATSVLERVVAMTSASRNVVKKHREGEQDPISRWFEDEFDYGAYRGRGEALVELISEKIEG